MNTLNIVQKVILKMISIINGDSHISLRILDWFYLLNIQITTR